MTQKTNSQSNKKKPNNPLFPKGGNKKGIGFNFYWIYGLLMLLIIGTFFIGGKSKIEEVGWHKLSEMVRSGDVEEVVVIKNRDIANIYLKKESISKYPKAYKPSGFGLKSEPNFIKNFGTLEHLQEKFDELNSTLPKDKIIEPTFEKESDWFGGLMLE